MDGGNVWLLVHMWENPLSVLMTGVMHPNGVEVEYGAGVGMF